MTRHISLCLKDGASPVSQEKPESKMCKGDERTPPTFMDEIFLAVLMQAQIGHAPSFETTNILLHRSQCRCECLSAT